MSTYEELREAAKLLDIRPEWTQSDEFDADGGYLEQISSTCQVCHKLIVQEAKD